MQFPQMSSIELSNGHSTVLDRRNAFLSDMRKSGHSNLINRRRNFEIQQDVNTQSSPQNEMSWPALWSPKCSQPSESSESHDSSPSESRRRKDVVMDMEW